jgi:plastocyanin
MGASRVAPAVLALLVGYWASGAFSATAQVNGNDNRISIMDDCLPGDPGWNPTGGCTLFPHQGDVPSAEFFALLRSPLTIPPNAQLIGHPSWRNEPSHLTVPEGKTVQVTNLGGRGHTFTEVENFGGGFAAVLNVGLMPAPECSPGTTTALPGGAREDVTGLAPGLHKFQCCIHPWMRATIRVE